MCGRTVPGSVGALTAVRCAQVAAHLATQLQELWDAELGPWAAQQLGAEGALEFSAQILDEEASPVLVDIRCDAQDANAVAVRTPACLGPGSTRRRADNGADDGAGAGGGVPPARWSASWWARCSRGRPRRGRATSSAASGCAR